jgi:hypothetical protein
MKVHRMETLARGLGLKVRESMTKQTARTAINPAFSV